MTEEVVAKCLLGCLQRLQFKSLATIIITIVTGCFMLFVLCDLFVSHQQCWPCTTGGDRCLLTWPHYCFPFITRVNREFFKLHYPDANDNVASPGPVPGQVVKQSIHSGKQEKNKQIRDKSGGKQIIFLQDSKLSQEWFHIWTLVKTNVAPTNRATRSWWESIVNVKMLTYRVGPCSVRRDI